MTNPDIRIVEQYRFFKRTTSPRSILLPPSEDLFPVVYARMTADNPRGIAQFHSDLELFCSTNKDNSAELKVSDISNDTKSGTLDVHLENATGDLLAFVPVLGLIRKHFPDYSGFNGSYELTPDGLQKLPPTIVVHKIEYFRKIEKDAIRLYSPSAVMSPDKTDGESSAADISCSSAISQRQVLLKIPSNTTPKNYSVEDDIKTFVGGIRNNWRSCSYSPVALRISGALLLAEKALERDAHTKEINELCGVLQKEYKSRTW